MGPILEFVVLEGVMERLFLWSLRRQFTEDMKLEQLRMYQMLLSQAKQPLLHHKPVLRPLMMLLASCAGAASGELEVKVLKCLRFDFPGQMKVLLYLYSFCTQSCSWFSCLITSKWI